MCFFWICLAHQRPEDHITLFNRWSTAVVIKPGFSVSSCEKLVRTCLCKGWLVCERGWLSRDLVHGGGQASTPPLHAPGVLLHLKRAQPSEEAKYHYPSHFGKLAVLPTGWLANAPPGKLLLAECDISVLLAKKESDSVSKKIGIGKKFRIRFRSDFGFCHTLAPGGQSRRHQRLLLIFLMLKRTRQEITNQRQRQPPVGICQTSSCQSYPSTKGRAEPADQAGCQGFQLVACAKAHPPLEEVSSKDHLNTQKV